MTGSKQADLRTASERAGSLQRELRRPVAIGFGIKTRQDVATVSPHVDGVVVGSAVVQTIEEASSPKRAVEAVRGLVGELAQGLGRP